MQANPVKLPGIFFRSEGIVGQFAQELSKFYQKRLNLLVPLPLHEKPKKLYYKATKKDTYLYFTNLLAEQELSLSNKTQQERQDSVYLQLTTQDYHAHRAVIKQSKLTKREDYIKTQTQSQRALRNAQTPKLISWQEYIMKLPDNELREQYIDQHDPPEFFVKIINSLCLQTQTESQTEVLRDTQKSSNNITNTRIADLEMTDYQQGTIATVYTDGSLKQNKMGSAGIVEYTTVGGTTKSITNTCKPTSSNPSSTKGEIMAIYMMSKSIPKHVRMKIHTDSQAAINAITNMLNNPTQRNKIKI